MTNVSRLGKQTWNLIKIFGVAVAFYLALTVKIGITWESDEISQFDYVGVQEEINNISSESDFDVEESHGTSTIYLKICTKYSDVCKKVNWSGVFTDEDKATKLAYVAYLLKKLDANISHWKVPSKALLAMLINEKKWSRRWSANRDTVTINLWWMSYNNEFFQVISHEMGHIVDLWWLQWTSIKKSSIFTEFDKSVFAIDDPSIEYYKYSWSSEKVRKSWITREDFCSWYGMSDPFEDFAECHNLYLNHHDYFYKLALSNSTIRNKYNYLSNLYWGKYINDSEAKYENWDNSYRVRDTTKIREW